MSSDDQQDGEGGLRCRAAYADEEKELRCMFQRGHPGRHETARMEMKGDLPDMKFAWRDEE